MNQKNTGLHTKNTLSAGKRSDLAFYILMIAFPIVQFIVFYVLVNGNVLLLAFKSFERSQGRYEWVGLQNIRLAFKDLTTDNLLINAGINSLKIYAWGLVVGVPGCLFFSYYIYKKMTMHSAFKVMLFLPSIISAIVMVLIFSYFVERALPEMIEKIFDTKIQGLLSNPSTAFTTVVFYNIFIGFGISMLMYVGAMNTISHSVIESAQLEGVSSVQEFFYIVLPLIYPTLVTFLTVGVAGIFINQANLFSFFSFYAPETLYTLGYYLFSKTANSATMANFPYLSAMGILMTVVALPLTLGTKKLLESIGPKVD